MKFGPERHVRKRHEFQGIQAQGRRVLTQNFVLIVARGPVPLAPSRLGITVTRRVGNSVRRSRIKRLVREAFRAAEGLVPPGFDVVVICRQDQPNLKSTDVLAEFRHSAKKLRKAIESLEATPLSSEAEPPRLTPRATPR